MWCWPVHRRGWLFIYWQNTRTLFATVQPTPFLQSWMYCPCSWIYTVGCDSLHKWLGTFSRPSFVKPPSCLSEYSGRHHISHQPWSGQVLKRNSCEVIAGNSWARTGDNKIWRLSCSSIWEGTLLTRPLPCLSVSNTLLLLVCTSYSQTSLIWTLKGT